MKSLKTLLKDKNVNAKTIDRIVNNISKVNQQISDDNFELGDGYCIGHSYFCPKGNSSDSFGDQWYEQISVKNLKLDFYPMKSSIRRRVSVKTRIFRTHSLCTTATSRTDCNPLLFF